MERARKVFAVRCGGSALHLSEVNRDRLSEILQQASRPTSPTESQAFAALGEFVVPYLKFDQQLPAKTAVACIRTLRMIDSKAARDCLASYSGDSRESVVAEYLEATDVVNSIGMRMRLVPAGEFGRGSSEESHRVHITQPFLLGAFPVTQEEYRRVMGDPTPSKFTGDSKLPVEQVSWFDAVQFCNRLSEMEGRTPFYNELLEAQGGDGYRLPTEAQWEYACRAGSTGMWCFGDDEEELSRFAWYHKNSKGRTHPVGQLEQNAWGLYDMHGNVWEWCWDWYAEYPAEDAVDPVGPVTGQVRVVRGGGWSYLARNCRSAFRFRLEPAFRHFNLGFRVAAVPPSQPAGRAEPRT